jgi:hypothetical protein
VGDWRICGRRGLGRGWVFVACMANIMMMMRHLRGGSQARLGLLVGECVLRVHEGLCVSAAGMVNQGSLVDHTQGYEGLSQGYEGQLPSLIDSVAAGGHWLCAMLADGKPPCSNTTNSNSSGGSSGSYPGCFTARC